MVPQRLMVTLPFRGGQGRGLFSELQWAMVISMLIHAGFFLCLRGEGLPKVREDSPVLQISLMANEGRGVGSSVLTTESSIVAVKKPTQLKRDLPSNVASAVVAEPAKVRTEAEGPAVMDEVDREPGRVQPDGSSIESAEPAGYFELEQAQETGDGIPAGKPGNAELDRPPLLIRDVLPIYPEEARFNGWEGRAILEFIIGVNGKVQEVRVVKSSGQACLDQAAVTAAKEWRYRPALRNGLTVTERIRRAVRFRLE